MRRPLLHLALAAALALLSASCLSPTLPLPPPEPDSIQHVRTDVWIVSGSCLKGARVTVFNETKGQGVVVEDVAGVGSFSVEIEADLCDQGQVSQTFGGEVSDGTPFIFDKPTATSSSSCH